VRADENAEASAFEDRERNSRKQPAANCAFGRQCSRAEFRRQYDAQDPDGNWWGKLLAALRRSRRVPHRKEEPVNSEPEPPEPVPPQTRRKRGDPK
jgi:hypothetical protein